MSKFKVGDIVKRISYPNSNQLTRETVNIGDVGFVKEVINIGSVDMIKVQFYNGILMVNLDNYLEKVKNETID